MKSFMLSKPLNHHRDALHHRSGVTLMECIFAIGVILTGLVGLAALIPVASQNARDTMEIDRSISESTSAAAVGLVRSFHELDSLVIFDKPVQGSPAYSAGAYSFAPSNAMQTIDAKINEAPYLKLDSPGYVHSLPGEGLQSGICIDPFGMPSIALMDSANSYVDDPTNVQPFYAVNANDSAYDYSRFPYYNERYDVLNPPNEQVGTPGTPVGPPATKPWPMGPRMWRATLKSPLYPSHPAPVGMRTHEIMSPVAIKGIFQGTSGVSSVTGSEDGDPRSVLVNQTLVGGSSIDAGRDGASDYTWFATLTPSFQGSSTYRQSVVVVRKRLPSVPRRIDDPFALQRNNYSVDDAYGNPDPDDNPSDERVTWINPSETIGFVGGSGGEVTVYGSQAVSDKIMTGTWVLLSRQPHSLGPVRATGAAVHRWYKVLSVGDVVTTSGYSWPGGTNNVWSRRLALAGPDWAFQDEDTAGGVNTTPIDDTFCTIVEGAVSVIESEVTLE
ncbi:hypothetical protein K227x_44300 [Rubripirellula lacrimiformis]|uniref:Uncharacterized protein n=2 Tax=Rubripirellula lacrimiformis TaxID=1930273 RepID=A0A517NG20_9BACT|nr:hypothetical protein K227x_44300 [Rubripirellula lacrimiformis]